MNLKVKRIQLRFSQSEIANQVGVDQTTISKWEKGKSFPRFQKLILLSKIFDCEIKDLIG